MVTQTKDNRTTDEVFQTVSNLRGASDPGKVEDGTRIHCHYSSFGGVTETAKVEASRAADLGLQRDRYTGRVSRVWVAGSGDRLMTMFVELEREGKYRTFNLDKGVLHNVVVLGD